MLTLSNLFQVTFALRISLLRENLTKITTHFYAIRH